MKAYIYPGAVWVWLYHIYSSVVVQYINTNVLLYNSTIFVLINSFFCNIKDFIYIINALCNEMQCPNAFVGGLYGYCMPKEVELFKI